MNRFDRALVDAPRGVSGPRGVVTSQHHAASEAGAAVLRAGGTAMDAAVATALALGVVEPWMSGIGGVGFMIGGRPGEIPSVFDFATRSPARLDRDDYPVIGGRSDDLFPWPMVEGTRNTLGPLSICAPTLVAGLSMGWRRFGRIPWAELVSPALALAREGLLVDWYTQLMIGSAAADLQSDTDSRALFLDDKGTGRASGWTAFGETRIPLPALADTLDTLAREGPEAMIAGDLARTLVDDVQNKGGVLDFDDMRAVEPRCVRPLLSETTAGHRIWSVPGLSGGSSVAAMLKRWNQASPGGSDNPDEILAHRVSSGIGVLRERLELVGDEADASPHPSCTTSFCVIDDTGFAIAATVTLVSIFGSKVLSPRTGVLLNNAVSWFDPVPGKANSLGPGKRPLANMAPTLIAHPDGRLCAVGAAGGRRICPAVAQVAAKNTLDGAPLESAMGEPRTDFRGDGSIVADARMPAPALHALRGIGPTNSVFPTVFPYHFAIVTAAEFAGAGAISGYSDPFCPNAGTATA